LANGYANMDALDHKGWIKKRLRWVGRRGFFGVRRDQFVSAHPNAVCDVSQSGPDPSRMPIVSMDEQPDSTAGDNGQGVQAGQAAFPIRAKAGKASQAAAVNRRRNRGFMTAGLDGYTGARGHVCQPVHLC
jgi:hypothetical protein